MTLLLLYINVNVQVAPAELEQLLLSHPDIADAAVVPYVNFHLINLD